MLHNLVHFGFTGPVYAVNPSATVVQSMPAYPSVDALPDAVDLVIVAVPAQEVLAVAQAAIRRGTRALAVLSAGFAEAGAAGGTLILTFRILGGSSGGKRIYFSLLRLLASGESLSCGCLEMGAVISVVASEA